MAVMVRNVASALLLLVAALGAGCGKDDPPVSVPMDAAVPPDPGGRKPDLSTPTETAPPASGGPISVGTGAAAGPGGTGSAKAGGRTIHPCCEAIEQVARSTKDEGQSRQYAQAARVCYQKANEILLAKISLAQGLAAVRSSLIGAAPSQCY
jgi:hypothetical protein